MRVLRRLLSFVLVVSLLLAMSALPGPPAAASPLQPEAYSYGGLAGVLRGAVSPVVASGKARLVAALAPQRVLRLALVLRPRHGAALSALAASGQHISPRSYQQRFAPSPSALTSMHEFVQGGGLRVLHTFRDLVLVQGTAAQVERLLHVRLNEYRLGGRVFFATASDPVLPASVASQVTGIVGLNQVPMSAESPSLSGGNSTSGFLTPDAVRTAYGLIPAYGNGVTGAGTSIAIVMTGGFNASDVQAFSQTFGLPFNAANIAAVPVQGTPVPSGVSFESTLDVEWAHAVAPGATITEYESGDLSTADLIAALDAAVTASPSPQVISMSFGGAEAFESLSDLTAWHQLFAAAVAEGETPVAASGDSGAFAKNYPVPSVSYPASDPLVLAVGGTRLTVNTDNQRTGESAWQGASPGDWQAGLTFGSGGGCSTVFSDLTDSEPAPASKLCGQRRGVPDVSAVAQGLMTYITGDGFSGWTQGSGTSYAAPIWSGIVALAAQRAAHPLGWARPAVNAVAASVAGAVYDVTSGYNGAFSAGTGWDAVTGWGTPGDGWQLVEALAAQTENTFTAGPEASGIVVNSSASPGPPLIANGVGPVDIVGSGFGSAQGTVTLTGQGGASYPVPVASWSSTDVTLNVDSSTGGLFAQSPHPMTAGEYTLTVKTGTGTSSNPLNVRLADFIAVSDSGPTPVTPAQEITSPPGADLQQVTVSVYTPDGSGIDTSADFTANLAVTAQPVWESQGQPGLTVEQGGSPISPGAGGGYPVAVTGGTATVDVASTGSTPSFVGDDTYTVSAAHDLPGVDSTAVFTPLAPVAIWSRHLSVTAATYQSSGSQNPVEVSLVDSNGNIVERNDPITATVSGATGTVTIDGQSAPYTSSLDCPSSVSVCGPTHDGETFLGVEDTAAETITLEVTDTTASEVSPLSLALHFTQAVAPELSPTSFTTPVSTSAQPSHADITVSAVDANGTSVPFPGQTVFTLSYAGTWDTVQEETFGSSTYQPLSFDAAVGGYLLDLSGGPARVRVSSTLAQQSVQYGAILVFGSEIVNGSVTALASGSGEFTPGPETSLDPVAKFPHMATSPAAEPQYDPVLIQTLDADGNQVASRDVYTLTEAAGGPSVSVAVYGQSGYQVLTPSSAGEWSFSFPTGDMPVIDVTSTQPGVADFTVADSTDSAVSPGSLTVDFVNSVASALRVVPPPSTVAGTPQTVTIDVEDGNGETVVSNSDQVALGVGSHKGQVTVTSGGLPLSPDASGRYVSQAVGGVVSFQVTDTAAETLSYTLSDLTQSVVTGTSANGVFVAGSPVTVQVGASPTSVTADGTSAAQVTATVYDAHGNPVPGVPVDFTTTLGNLSAASATSKASGQATVSLTSLKSGAAQVTATVTGIAPASVTVTFTAATIPDLQGLSPKSGSGGTVLTATGTNFGTVAGAVYFQQGASTVKTSPSSWSPTRVVTLVPTEGLVPGAVAVAVYAQVYGMSNDLFFTWIGSPASVRISASPTSVTADGTSAAEVAATVVDADGNPVPGVPVDFTTTLGNLGAASATSNVSGQAVVSLTSLKSGTAQVTATVSGVAPVSSTVTFTAGPAAQLAFTAQPGGGTAGAPWSLQPQVTVEDAHGNPVTDSTVAVTLAVTGGTGAAKATLTCAADPVAAVSGVAGFSGCSIDEAGAGYTLTASAGGLGGAVSEPFDVVPGGPASVRVAASPTSVPADGTSAAEVTATVVDADGNPVPGVPVDFTTTLGGLSAPSARTNVGGVAQVTLVSAVAGSALVTAVAGGVSGSADVSFTAVSFAPPAVVGPPVSSSVPPTPRGQVASVTVGPQGGTISSPHKTLELKVPPGAFSAGTRVTVTRIDPSKAPTPPRGFAATAALVITTSDGAQPAEPVTLVMHFDPRALNGLSASRLGVYVYDPTAKTWQWIGGVVNLADDTITVTLPHLSTYAVLVNEERFSDMGQAPWARTAVDQLLGAGIVTGVAAGRFDPEGHVTRAEFTKMLVLADGLAPLASGSLPFRDVPAGAWFAPYVRAAYRAKLVAGVSGTSFDPDSRITRVEMAVMLSRLPGLAGAAAGSLAIFRDGAKVPAWAVPGVEKTLGAGLVRGLPGAKFDPQGTTTRAQAALVIARYLELTGKV